MVEKKIFVMCVFCGKYISPGKGKIFLYPGLYMHSRTIDIKEGYVHNYCFKRV